MSKLTKSTPAMQETAETANEQGEANENPKSGFSFDGTDYITLIRTFVIITFIKGENYDVSNNAADRHPRYE